MSGRCRGPSRHGRRLAALLLGALLLLSLLLSAAFVLAEQHHHCTGEHCEICAAITHTVAFLKAEASVSLPPVFALVAILALALSGVVPVLPDVAARSPVSLRVKLSD
ncbi:MAG: hypothetical protein GX417_10990 [Clostridiales bacterium]|nr:hypothetical protein [Clostridiales bacterium]